jgi:hypothetical protein
LVAEAEAEAEVEVEVEAETASMLAGNASVMGESIAASGTIQDCPALGKRVESY